MIAITNSSPECVGCWLQTALVQASNQGLLVFNPVAGKRLRQNAVVEGLPASPPRKRARGGMSDVRKRSGKRLNERHKLHGM